MSADEITCRIYPASRDLLQLQAVADKYGVTLVIGGEPLRVRRLEGFGFGRGRHPADWVVAYISGDPSNLIDMHEEWQKWLIETADQYDQMLFEEAEAKAEEIYNRIMQKNKKDPIAIELTDRIRHFLDQATGPLKLIREEPDGNYWLTATSDGNVTIDFNGDQQQWKLGDLSLINLAYLARQTPKLDQDQDPAADAMIDRIRKYLDDHESISFDKCLSGFQTRNESTLNLRVVVDRNERATSINRDTGQILSIEPLASLKLDDLARLVEKNGLPIVADRAIMAPTFNTARVLIRNPDATRIHDVDFGATRTRHRSP